MKRRFFYCAVILCFCCRFSLPAQISKPKSDFEAGLFYFRANKPNDAIELFEKAMQSPDFDKSAFIYLGVSYFQINEHEKSLETCKKGLETSGTDKKVLAYNAGNACFALKRYSGAEEYFRKSLSEDANFVPAVLNLANTLVEEEKYGEAIGFYEKFLALAKNDPQCDTVREIIEKLKAEVAKHREPELELVSLDDVEYLNRLDAEAAASGMAQVASGNAEKVGEDYFLMARDDSVYLVAGASFGEKFVDDYESEIMAQNATGYKVQGAELFVHSDENGGLGEKLGEEFLLLKIEDSKITVKSRDGKKLLEKDLSYEKISNEDFFENLNVDRGELVVLGKDDEPLLMKIEDDLLIAPPEAEEGLMISLHISDDFTPDGDGHNDVAKISVTQRGKKKGEKIEGVASWEVLILDAKGGVLKRYNGGSDIPEVIEFDGTGEGKRELDIMSATDYTVKARVTLKDDTVVEANSILSTGILVIQDGDKFKIKVPNINFDPNEATMDTLTKAQLASNDKILTMVAYALKQFQEYNVTVEGHANSTTGTEEEETKELIPLSRARARAIMQILIEKGIEKSRLSAVGMGGRRPIASGAESYKNRRVEFILEK